MLSDSLQASSLLGLTPEAAPFGQTRANTKFKPSSTSPYTNDPTSLSKLVSGVVTSLVEFQPLPTTSKMPYSE